MTRALLIVGFLIAFGAGLVIGLEMHQPAQPVQAAPAAPATRPSGPDAYLAAQLDLSPAQNEQVKQIWSETGHRGGREMEDRRRQSRKDRDDAVAALIRPEDKPKYDAALRAYADRQAEADREGRASLQAAVERIKKILNPEQAKKYDEFLKKREAERAQREHDSNRRPDTRATSRPAPEK